MKDVMDVRAMLRRWLLPTLGSLTVISGAIVAQPAQAQPKACITDAELDAAVGDQIRSGAFAINTSKLREAPMCSGLTVAQSIQKIAEGGSPRAQPGPPPSPGLSNPPAGNFQTPGIQSPAGGSPYRVVEQYVGKAPDAKVGGFRLFDHPLVAAKLKEAEVEGLHHITLSVHTGSYSTKMDGHVLVNSGCFPESCKQDYHTLYMNLQTGAAVLCYVGGQWDEKLWFSKVTYGEWLELQGPACPANYRSAPAKIRKVLEEGAANYAGGGTGQNLPDITSALVFDEPKTCHSESLVRLFYAAIDRKSAPLGARGQIKFRRSGPDNGGYLSDVADINARWNGLTITRLEFQHLPDTDSTAKTIVFKESAEMVKPVLSRKGIPTGKIGEQIEVGDEMPIAITFSRHGSGSSLSCGT